MTEEQQDKRQFVVQKIYTKDISFESPNAPDIFTDQEWKPEVDLNLNASNQKLPNNSFEVVLKVTVTVKQKDKVAFLVEVDQAGIFGIKDFPEAEMGPLLGSYCPNILFPYAREAVSDLVSKGGFPQLLLAPVNFDAVYAQHVQQAQAGTQGENSSVQ